MVKQTKGGNGNCSGVAEYRQRGQKKSLGISVVKANGEAEEEN